jgi:serine/threonine-protein kinase
MRCPSCGSENPSPARFCGGCGAELAGSTNTPTELKPADKGTPAGESSPSSSSAIDTGRFAPGTMLSGRYRIVAQLGRGGMGEVYRADDMKLGQPVALKLLPEEFARDPSRLSRFHHEVRIARQVSHANVCRVYDIGEVDGEHFISMEYIDGEDLSSLLKRIGHLPQERAIILARQLCAGLAAAHSQGILHRDLKPANVMIDGEGRVRITDFGLAAVAGQVEGAEVRAGTPRYMAPEQLSGREVTVASDIFALGLVLYELFTGESLYHGAESLPELQRLQREVPITPSSVVPGLEPAVEQVILRCLEAEPQDRPVSALAVAATLPGADPLAAALAAGETPSPELVAESGSSEGLKPAVAMSCLVVFLMTVGIIIGLSGRNVLVRRAALETPPEVLEAKAREVILEAGYENPPADSVHTFLPNDEYIDHLLDLEVTSERWEVLRNRQPAAVRFVYRQSPQLLVRFSAGSIYLTGSSNLASTWLEDPPATLPGMVEIGLDMEGRLLSFSAIPPQRETPGESSAEADWGPLFTAAGFDQQMFTAVAPVWLPLAYADRRAAWEGVYPEAPDIKIRVEAAAYRGRPVFFRVIEPWTRQVDAAPMDQGFWARVGDVMPTVWYVVVLVGAGLVALRNIRLGRGDRKTALRFALYCGGVRFLWILGSEHLPSVAEMELFASHMAWALYRVGLVWVFYLALEPYARKLWPHMLVSWVRLLNGRARDPLVGRDILVGVLYGAFMAVVSGLLGWIPEILGLSRYGFGDEIWSWESLRGLRQAIAAVAGIHVEELVAVLLGILMLLVMRLLLRRTWIALGVVIALTLALFNPGSGHPAPWLIGLLVLATVHWLVLFRFGLLPVVLGTTVGKVLLVLPLTYDLTAWYGYVTVVVLCVTVGVAVWGFWIALAGRPLFRDETG